MDPRELGRGQVESGNPKMKSRRERAGQMVVVVVVVERETLLWIAWAVHERVPHSNRANTISDPQTLILIPFPFSFSVAQLGAPELRNPNGNPNSEAWIWDEREEGRDGWRASTLVDSFFCLFVFFCLILIGEGKEGEEVTGISWWVREWSVVAMEMAHRTQMDGWMNDDTIQPYLLFLLFHRLCV